MSLTTNANVLKWVDEMIALCKPDKHEQTKEGKHDGDTRITAGRSVKNYSMATCSELL